MTATTSTLTTCDRCNSTDNLWTDCETDNRTMCDDCRIEWFDWSDANPTATFSEWPAK